MLIEIDGRRYPMRGIEDLELRHVAKLQFELRSGEFDGITSLRTIDDIRAALAAWNDLSKAERKTHPDGVFLTCFAVWSARVLAGEGLTLMEAISVPAASLRIIAEPEDLAGGEGEGKARPRRAAPAAGARPDRRRKPKR